MNSSNLPTDSNPSSSHGGISFSQFQLSKLDLLRLMFIVPFTFILFFLCLIVGIVCLEVYTQAFCSDIGGSVCYEPGWHVVEDIFITFFASLYAFGIVIINPKISPIWKREVCLVTLVIGSSLSVLVIFENTSLWPISLSCIFAGLASFKITNSSLPN